MSETPRVVIDTQIFLRAAIARHTLIGKIIFDMRDKYQIIFSAETRKEIEDVLNRPKIRVKFTHITDEVVQKVLNIFDSAELATLPDPLPGISRDPKDDIFLACAVAGGADYLISEDQDLLVLNPYKDIQIINIPTFFQIIA